jgi:formyltetrahydrofolate hydrolase
LVLSVGGNILHAEQHIDPESGISFQRVEFELDRESDADELEQAFRPVAERYGMAARLHVAGEVMRIAVLASRQPHCLADVVGHRDSADDLIRKGRDLETVVLATAVAPTSNIAPWCTGTRRSCSADTRACPPTGSDPHSR